MEQPQGLLAILQAGSWIAQTGLFLFAAIAVLVGKEQIKTAIIHNRASVVLELDNRWESDAMIESRTLLTDLYETVRAAHAPEAWTRTYNKHLADLRSKDPTKYRTMMRLAGYFETAGWVIGKRYVEKEDFLDLFRVSVVVFGKVFEEHLVILQRLENSPKLYEHALSLIRETKDS